MHFCCMPSHRYRPQGSYRPSDYRLHPPCLLLCGAPPAPLDQRQRCWTPRPTRTRSTPSSHACTRAHRTGQSSSVGTHTPGAGHHRVVAALDAGVKDADLFVRTDIRDEEMIRLYATENATQRGSSSTALAGTVASAIKFKAKETLGGPSREFTGRWGEDSRLGNLTSAHHGQT